MPKKKVYAVKKGRQTGLFETWEECRRMVQGVSGAVYKSFATRQEAQDYLDADAGQNHPPQPSDAGGGLTAYVDGSYDHKIRRYSFGCILLTPDGQIIRECGSGSDKSAAQLRNVTGEMLGAIFAVRWAQKNDYHAVTICYDYAGIEQWATHGWQAKNELTKQYADFMDRSREHIAVSFTKIAAHTGDKYNEEADRLAKLALTKPEGMPAIM